MKKTYLIIMVVSIVISLSSLSVLMNGISERGFGKVNYGALIPVFIAVWSFAKWRKARKSELSVEG